MGGEVAAATAGEVLLADAAMVSGNALTSTLGAGITDAALLGGEFAGGLGATGALTGGLGLGSAGLLGGEFAGGLGSLAPAFQQATAATAAFNPETASQVIQAANAGAVPPAGATFGWNPADLSTVGQGAGDIGAAQASSGFQNAGEFRDLTTAETADVTKNIKPEFMNSLAPTTTPEPGMKELEPGWASKTSPIDTAKPSPFSALRTLTQPVQDWWDDQNTLTKYGLGATGAMQAAKYLNKPQGVAAPEKYSGPLSKFSYSPDRYTPYNYRPYAAGGPVEEMSHENAIGANTGYPQSDIQQGAYATPWQTPVSRNVVAGAGDVGVDQMTGMERMAEGGTAEAAPAMPAVAASQQNFSDFLSRYQGAPEQAGLAALTSTERSLPAVMASRQNFADFLARYQNMPVMENMPVVTGQQPTQYQGLYYTPPGSYIPDSNTSTSSSSDSYDSGASSSTNSMARGGKTKINPMEAIDNYMSQASSGEMAEVLAKARSGDYNAMLALNKLRGTPNQNYAGGGIANLGGYSDGGRLLKGPGDGMSDNIPATIGSKQPARLADGEFVVPADVVSGLGNGSTEAGAKQLYKMLDKVRSARTGTKKQGKEIKPEKYTPA